MSINELINQRFTELENMMNGIKAYGSPGREEIRNEIWEEWATSVLNLIGRSLGDNSIHFKNFQTIYERHQGFKGTFEQAKGVFLAAKHDYEGGYAFELESALSGLILEDFVILAKATLHDGNKDVAAVLASAALEDALKRYARKNELNVDDKVMQEVVSALKSKSLVSGAQKSLLDTMPKLRDYAMHANWDKLTKEDVGSIIGFVEQFLHSHFS